LEEANRPLPPPEPAPGRVAALGFHGVPEPLRSALTVGPLDRALRFGALTFDRPLLVAGPPGAGKTLTVVRLATRLILAGTVPMIVAADANKAGATEQLLAFTRILRVPLIHAPDAMTLARALAQRRNGAPVLIDAPGSDPFDAAQADSLRALIGASDARSALVLPSGLDPAEAGELGRAYAALGADSLIATRLDLSRRLGGVLAAAHAGRLALTEAGIGPGIPDGLVPLTPDFLLNRLLRTGTPRHDL
jgi:flagellar biosynthesis protein FlhF